MVILQPANATVDMPQEQLKYRDTIATGHSHRRVISGRHSESLAVATDSACRSATTHP
jgi:hypothetical protein